MRTVPNKPKTPVSNFRIPAAEKDPAQSLAESRGETLTDVVRRALREYVRSGGSWPPSFP